MPSLSANKLNLNHLKRFDSKWHEWTLPNKLKCLHIPLPKGDPRFQITYLNGTGSRFEPKEWSGISHLLEHMMFRGSAKYPSFSDLSIAFERLGGEWNAATGHEYTEFYFNGTVKKSKEAIELFADFLMRPALHDLATELKIVKRELEGELNENGVSTDPDYHIATKIWPNSAMAMPIIGTPDSLGNINSKILRSWYEKNYSPQNSVICVVGGRFESIEKDLSKQFANWNNPQPELQKSRLQSNFSGPYAFWVENSDNEFQIQMSFLCDGTGSSKSSTYELITRILSDGFSSRLTKRIREELGLVYDVSADLHQYLGAGLINITASVLSQNLKPFFKEVFQILDELSTINVPSSELERHKYRAITDLEMTTSEPTALAWRGGWAALAQIDGKLANWAEEFSKIDAEAIRSIAGEIFAPQNMCVTALGPNENQIDSELSKMTQNWRKS